MLPAGNVVKVLWQNAFLSLITALLESFRQVDAGSYGIAQVVTANDNSFCNIIFAIIRNQYCNELQGSCYFSLYPQTKTNYRYNALALVFSKTVCILLFREKLSEKTCTPQSRKVIWDMFNTLFLTLLLSNLLLLLSFSPHRHMSTVSPAILSNFFEKQ